MMPSSSSSSSSFPSSPSSSVASCRHQRNFYRDANGKCKGEDNDKDCTLSSEKPSSSGRKNENDDENREDRKSMISASEILRKEKSMSSQENKYEEANEEKKNSVSSAGFEPAFVEAAAEVAAAEMDVASPEGGSVQYSSFRNHHNKGCNDKFNDESLRERKGKKFGRAASVVVVSGGGGCGNSGSSLADSSSFPSLSSLAARAGSDGWIPGRAASSSSRLSSTSRVNGIGRDASKDPNSPYVAGFSAAAVDVDANHDAAAIAANYAAAIRATSVSAGTNGRTASANSPMMTMMSAAARAYWMQHNNPPPFFRECQNLLAMEAEEVGTAALPFSVRHQQWQTPSHLTTPTTTTTTTTTELATQLLLRHHRLHDYFFQQQQQQQFQQRQQYFHRHCGIGQESAPSFSSTSSRHSPVPIRSPVRNLLRTSPTPLSPTAPPRSRTVPLTVAEAQEASATTAAAIAEMGYGRMTSLVASEVAIRRLMTWRIMANRMAVPEAMAQGAVLGERRERGGNENGKDIENAMDVYAGGGEGETVGEGADEGGGHRRHAVGVAVAGPTTFPTTDPRINRPIATTMEAIGHCTEAAESGEFYDEGREGDTAETTEAKKVLAVTAAAEEKNTFSATIASSYNLHSIGNENFAVAATGLPPQPNTMAGTDVRQNRQEKEKAATAAAAAAAAIRRYSQYHVNTAEPATTWAQHEFGLSRKEKFKGGKCNNDGVVTSKATQQDKQSPSMANCVPQDSDDGDGDGDSNEEEEMWSTTRTTIEKTASSSRACRAVAEKVSAGNVVLADTVKARCEEGEEGKQEEGLKYQGDFLACVRYGGGTDDGGVGANCTVPSRESAGEEVSGGGANCDVLQRKFPATNLSGGGGRGGGGGNDDDDDTDGDATDDTAPSALKRRLPRIARINRKRRTHKKFAQGGEASDGGAGSGGGGTSASLSFDPSYGIDRQFPHRLDGCDHLPEWSSKRHNCKLCYFRSGEEKKSHVMCTRCGVYLCFNQKRNCYRTWHSERRVAADDDGSLSEC